MSHNSRSILAVILNWNELELSIKCIESLICQRRVAVDILLIDNHSEENPAGKLRDRFPDLHTIVLDENRGVAGGRNVGIHHALENGYNYLLFLDNDAYAHHDMIANLMAVMEKNSDVAITGPKIYMDGKKEVIWRCGCLSWRWTYLFSPFSIIRNIYKLGRRPVPTRIDIVRGEGHKDVGQYDNERNIDFQIGCAQMIRTRVFEYTGMLDERFIPYGSEDIDFCERVVRAGWFIKYVPEAVCWHRVDQNYIANPSKTYHNLKNIILLARKHLSRQRLYFHFIPDFLFVHLPLVFIESVLKNKKCTKALLSAVRWHLEDIKLNGLSLQ